jgi:polyhydroxyalkanoate synthesis repressor PhaR
MQVIKKYANRKLYHTNRKQYITLEGIARLIQEGADVQVIENETGADITAQILAQVVLQASGSKSLLPAHLLTGIIQASGDTLVGLRRSVQGALSGSAAVDAEIRRRLGRLREEGTIDTQEQARLEGLLIQGSPPTPRAEAPSASDIERLSNQIDALTAVVEQLLAERNAKG